MRNPQASRAEEVRRIFADTARTYERAVNLTTLGMDALWKRRMFDITRQRVSSPAKILDLACGTGLVTFALAGTYPDSTIVGLDITPEYLDIARSKMQPHQRDRIFFHQHNADELEKAELAEFGPFDLIVSSYLPKYVDLSKLTRNCHALLAPGGLLLIHDFTRPRLLLLRALYNVYWLILSLFLRFSPWREAGRDLKKIIWRNDWVREFETVCRNLNCRLVETRWQPLQISCIAFFVRDGS